MILAALFPFLDSIKASSPNPSPTFRNATLLKTVSDSFKFIEFI